ncbi:nuclear transport factor 2 family protein [Streptomyces sp. NPDC002144]|uniref:nuclear transport factor 2 family protein n=1 Tax=Streptomyces sp. NPDC001351 TaxID=3364564 RepID=UPI0036B1DD84
MTTLQHATGVTVTSGSEVYPDAGTEPPKGTAEHALWLVHWHLEWENPEQLDQLATLYSDDITWEFHIPGADLVYGGKPAVLDNYRRLLVVLQDLQGSLVDAYATSERCFIDQRISYVVGPGSEGLMDPSVLPPGARVEGRLMHNFHVRDGLLSREVAYFVPSPPVTS